MAIEGSVKSQLTLDGSEIRNRRFLRMVIAFQAASISGEGSPRYLLDWLKSPSKVIVSYVTASIAGAGIIMSEGDEASSG